MAVHTILFLMRIAILCVCVCMGGGGGGGQFKYIEQGWKPDGCVFEEALTLLFKQCGLWTHLL